MKGKDTEHGQLFLYFNEYIRQHFYCYTNRLSLCCASFVDILKLLFCSYLCSWPHKVLQLFICGLTSSLKEWNESR